MSNSVINTEHAYPEYPGNLIVPTEVLNIHVDGAGKTASGIWQVPVGQTWTLTADVAIPDGTFMVIAERVVNGVTPIDDERFLGTVTAGKFSMTGKFFNGGNYVITSKRLNEGLAVEGIPIYLSFNKVDFDAYRVV